MPKEPAVCPLSRRRGFESGHIVADPGVGGWVVVWRVADAGKNLPPLDYEAPFAVRHHCGALASRGAIQAQTKREAQRIANAIARGKHEIALQKLVKEAPEEPKAPPPGKGSKGGENEKKPRPHATPPLPPLETVPPVEPPPMTQDAVSQEVQRGLIKIGTEKIIAAIESGLDAVTLIYTKDNPEPERVPDSRTQLAAAKLAFEYLIGKPVERRIVEERKSINAQDIKKRLAKSRYYRDEMRKLLDSLESGIDADA